MDGGDYQTTEAKAGAEPASGDISAAATAFDEMVDQAGNPRPLWKPFIESLEELGADELQKRFARADRYLRDAGVYLPRLRQIRRQRA